MLNKIQLIGRLGATPELRESDNSPYVFVSLATSEYWRDNQGNRQEHTEWHDLAFWASNAKTVSEIAGQGDLLYIEGKIRTRTVEKDGESRRYTSVIVTRWQLLKKAGKAGQADDAETVVDSDDEQDAPEAA
jgi:single-strand DNA-binding protein